MKNDEKESEASIRGAWAAPEPPAPKDWRDHVLLIGPPGVGKTLWAKLQSREVPLREWSTRQSDAEYLYRLCQLESRTGIDFRPFRAPHHSVSMEGMTGRVRKGWRVTPGELSLAHGGVLFLDEVIEFRRDVIEQVIRAARAGSVPARLDGGQMLKLPSEFRLIVASGPCPCGFRGHARETCRCTDKQVERYLSYLAPIRTICREVPSSEWLPAVNAIAEENARQRADREKF